MDEGIGYESRQELIRELQLRLADGIVDVELDREHYDIAIKRALGKYRQISGGSVEESILFITTKPDQVEYQLPSEVMEIRRVYRRGIGTSSGTGTNFDPFDAAYANAYFLSAGAGGGLSTFDFYSQWKETAGRIFGSEYDFQWNHNTKLLRLLRNVRAEEDILCMCYNYVPEAVLLKDVYASYWLVDYALAQCKLMLGEARSKYQSGLPGAGGAITLNGEQLKAEGQQEVENLLQSISNMEEGNSPLSFTIG